MRRKMVGCSKRIPLVLVCVAVGCAMAVGQEAQYPRQLGGATVENLVAPAAVEPMAEV